MLDMSDLEALVARDVGSGWAIVRVYRAFEGDLRVIVRNPDFPWDLRYTVEGLDTGCPELRKM